MRIHKVWWLRDPRFGVSSRKGTCRSCGMTWSKCSGHFGHYVLPRSGISHWMDPRAATMASAKLQALWTLGRSTHQ